MTFIQARHFTPGRPGAITGVVIHDEESPEVKGSAVNVADFFAGPNAPQASAHYTIDSESVVQCVNDTDTAWHAPPANAWAIGFEHAGYASQSSTDWHDPYSLAMLHVSANLLAAKSVQYGFPLVFLTAADMLAGNCHGVTTHAQVTAAWHQSTHTDPGPNFPMTEYLAMAQILAHPQPVWHIKPFPGVMSPTQGNAGSVTLLQNYLIVAKYLTGPATGHYDAATIAAVKHLQHDAIALHVTGFGSGSNTGFCGGATWEWLGAVLANKQKHGS